MSVIKRILRKIKLKLANRSWNSKREYLRKQGAVIGDRTRFNGGVDTLGTEPYLVTVGSDCLFAGGVNIFTHDGGVSVLNNLGCFDGKKMEKMARVKIGNNVYVGAGAKIMMGVTIGDNCIIGAGAIVTKDIPDNSVAVGIPAKRIKSVEEYYNDAVAREQIYCTDGMSSKKKKEYLKNCVK